MHSHIKEQDPRNQQGPPSQGLAEGVEPSSSTPDIAGLQHRQRESNQPTSTAITSGSFPHHRNSLPRRYPRPLKLHLVNAVSGRNAPEMKNDEGRETDTWEFDYRHDARRYTAVLSSIVGIGGFRWWKDISVAVFVGDERLCVWCLFFFSMDMEVKAGNGYWFGFFSQPFQRSEK